MDINPTPHRLQCTTDSQVPYQDASGAPCVVEVRLGRQILIYAADRLGETTLQLLSRPVGMTQALYVKAAYVARHQYFEWLVQQVQPEWFEANQAMYADRLQAIKPDGYKLTMSQS